MKDNVMIDLETLGTVPGSVILSIGAVDFDAEGVGEHTFYQVINQQDSLSQGFQYSHSTLAWWEEQSPEAQKIIHEAKDPEQSVPVLSALSRFQHYLGPNVDTLKVWGNGASFDNAMLTSAYAFMGEDTPWKFYNDRCHRTLKNLFPQIASEPFHGTAHNALDDAINQAQHAVKILKFLQEK